MCGIAGYRGSHSSSLLRAFNDAQAHRGPDGAGEFFDEKHRTGLAHTRLAIVDLSDAGAQPMASAGDDGRFVVTYNGELYNADSLRDRLADDGTFRGHSDTEVLLHAWRKFGPRKTLDLISGIFAFAMLDRQSGELWIVRDGLGVKPLYYTQTASGFAFASELKALLALPDLDRSLDPVAAARYVSLLWSPGERTMFRAVKKLRPGHALVFREGAEQPSEQRFYQLPLRDASDLQEVSPQETAQVISAAVSRQTLSPDVPVGAFLSGGLDSSAIAAFASRDRELSCFTAAPCGDAWGGEGFTDDLPFANKVANELGVDLNEVPVESDLLGELEKLVWNLDEPQADPAALIAARICRLASERGIKVLLSGAGGDDVFSGYRRHLALAGLDRISMRVPRPLRQLMEKSSALLAAGSSPTRRRLARYLDGIGSDPDSRTANYFLWLNAARTAGLFGGQVNEEDVAAPLLSALDECPDKATPLDRMLALDARFFLADHNLNYTDKMGMAEGVEVRVPLIDRAVVEHGFSIPAAQKVRRGEAKWIFKQAMRPHLPKDVIFRPKAGFGVPLRQWMRNGGGPNEQLDDLLSADSLSSRRLFDPQAVRDLIERDRCGAIDAAYPLLAIACVELWCRKFADAPIPTCDRGAPLSSEPVERDGSGVALAN